MRKKYRSKYPFKWKKTRPHLVDKPAAGQVSTVDQARLFWAVILPAEMKRKLAGFQSRLRELPADVKWVEQQNLHLTVKFLGNVNRSAIRKVVWVVEGAVTGTGDFNLELGGAGFFPNSRRPRVVWVGLRGEVDKFRRLHQCVDASLETLGFAADERGFTPHLTLGRVRSAKGSSALVQRVEEMAEEVAHLGKVKVRAIELIESQLTRKGPVYTMAARVNLIHISS